MDFRIELVPLAVSDVDRSVEFYGTKVGWNVDHDQKVSPELRFVRSPRRGRRARSASASGWR
jgi:predicted enzyme related to lactoylglutathione lyase